MADIPIPPFAIVSDLEKRWRALTVDEQSRASVLIDDASDKVMTTCPGYVSASAATLTRIVCAMVRRAMAADDNGIGVSSSQETQGPFNQSFSYSNPLGDLYMTKAEMRELGKGTQRAFHVDMADGSVS